MPVELYVGQAASGKTTFCVEEALRAARGLAQTPWIVVPGPLQEASWRRRLAGRGQGALGVRVGTFYRLYAACLTRAGVAHTHIGDAVQYRLLRVLLDRVPLEHLGGLRNRPGFVSALQSLVGALRASLVDGAAFRSGVDGIGATPRLRDLAAIYSAYEEYLALNAWEDDEGLGWAALRAAQDGADAVGLGETLVVADGFDALTPLEATFLRHLGSAGVRVVVAVTSVPESATGLLGDRPRLRLKELEEMLGTSAGRTPRRVADGQPTGPTGALGHLRRSFFSAGVTPEPDPQQTLVMMEAPDRAAEVRVALRWLKAELLRAPDRPEELCLLARNLDAYRATIVQIAEEYGIPIGVAGGLPLRDNPAVAALLDLLRTMEPLAGQAGEPSLPRRLVLEAWRSPYLSWTGPTSADDPAPVGVTPEAARVLDEAARAGSVIRGLSQWEEALDRWAARQAPPTSDEDAEPEPADRPAVPPAELRDTFRRFVTRLTPPAEARTLREYVRWAEELIGPAAAPEDEPARADDERSLRIVHNVRAEGVAPERRDADLAALQRLKEVMRGLVWAEEALGADRPVDYARFLEELTGAVEPARYQLPRRADRRAVQVAGVEAAAGVAYRAVALVGLAEGEFPAPLSDDPFLTEAERRALRERDPSLRLPRLLDSRELEWFYRAVAAPWERLLLVRPRLSETGAPWAPSPYWEEAARLTQSLPVRLTSDRPTASSEACSWQELLATAASAGSVGALRAWLDDAAQPEAPGRELTEAMDAASVVLRARRRRRMGPYDGDLREVPDLLARRFPPGRAWSASRLEEYRACPLWFYVRSVLGLEPRQEPGEGLDSRQRGTVVHRILEHVYALCGAVDDAEALLAALPEVAARVLDEAPRLEGFRETAWWQHTRAEIEENLRKSIVAMAAESAGYRLRALEARFGEPKALEVRVGATSFRVRGVIDRVDIAPDGTLRIIDYKTGGSGATTQKALEEARKLQLPLYAAAARDVLGLGEPAEGYYWHVSAAQKSAGQLSKFVGGAEGAIRVASEAAAQAVDGVGAGHFAPQQPQGGCPPYCPAAGFCWHLSVGSRPA